MGANKQKALKFWLISDVLFFENLKRWVLRNLRLQSFTYCLSGL